jgi:hypothetical protein
MSESRGMVVKVLAITGGALLVVGLALLASSRQPLIGAILAAVGATDLVIAFGMSRRAM